MPAGRFGPNARAAAGNAARGAGAGAAVVGLLNGVRVLAVLLNAIRSGTSAPAKVPVGPVGPTGTVPAPIQPRRRKRKYTIDVHTKDQRTDLQTDGDDMIKILAHVLCSDPTVNTKAMTRNLQFRAEGENASWLKLHFPRQGGIYRAVEVRAEPPSNDAELKISEATVMVSATIEGQTINMPVELTLEEIYEVRFLPA